MKKGLHFFVTALLVTLFAVGATAQKPADGYYKIKNAETGKYVSVKSKYYAKPDVTEDDATPIYIGIGDKVLGGGYKIISLKGDGIEVFDYLTKAVNLAKTYAEKVLTNKGSNSFSEEEVVQACELMDRYVAKYGFLQIESSGNNTYFVYAEIPDFSRDAELTALAQAHGVDNVWEWGKRKVLEYIDKSDKTDATLKALVRANIEKIEEGHTYLLSADSNDTFGYIDMDEYNGELSVEWSLNEYVPEPGLSGYYRIMNAGSGMFVNVTGKFKANPELTAAEAVTEAGSVIYVGMGDRVGKADQDVIRLSAQGRNVNSLAERAIAKVKELATEYVDDMISENPDLESYRADFETLMETYEFQKMVRVEAAATENGDAAYFCKYTTPSLDPLANKINVALSMNRGQGWASRHPDLFEWNADHTKAVSLKVDAFWEKAKSRLIEEVQARGYNTQYPDLYKHFMANINKINPGVTYYLTADRDDTFGYVSRDNVEAAGDMAKWVLDPVVNDGNYFAVAPTLAHTNAAEVKYVTTLYTDFPYSLPDGVEAYKVTGIEQQEGAKGYICTKAAISGKVPAETPVLLICDSSEAEDCKLEPVDEFSQNGGSQGAPARVTEASADNLLVAAYFDEQAESQNLRALGENGGVGFCLPASQLDGNVAYLDADQLNPSTEEIYYIFPEEEETGISTLVSDAQVVNVKYVNAAGQVADAAFDGVNIVVKTLSNGAKVITKVVK